MNMRERLIWIGLSCFFYFSPLLVYGQDAETRVDKIDIAHVVSYSAVPHRDSDGRKAMVCEVHAVHDDKTVYTAYVYTGFFKDDDDLVVAVKGSFNACRDALISFLKEFNTYHASIVDAKNYRKP